MYLTHFGLIHYPFERALQGIEHRQHRLQQARDAVPARLVEVEPRATTHVLGVGELLLLEQVADPARLLDHDSDGVVDLVRDPGGQLAE